MIKPSKLIADIEPYSITSQEVWSFKNTQSVIKLDWNEAPYDFHFYKKEASRIFKKEGIFSWYSDYQCLKLERDLSLFLNLPSSFFSIFPGSDTALESFSRCFVSPNDKILMFTPTYENFFVFGQQVGAKLIKVKMPLPFKENIQFIEENIKESGCQFVYIPNPNNPCGYEISAENLIYLIKKYKTIIFMIDEAYIEFSNSHSLINEVQNYKNLAVFRTFSKAFGLAGVRLGYVASDITNVKVIEKIRNGKNVSMIAQYLGSCGIKNFDKIKSWIAEVNKNKQTLYKLLDELEINYFPSGGNFVLFFINRPKKFVSLMKAKKIFIRDRSNLIFNGVRITIGNNEQMNIFFNLLKEYVTDIYGNSREV